jgi:Ala-tRNA(Pro) deacylase
MYVREYLTGQRVWFETILHRPAPSASRLAGSVHVPGRHVAKAVLVQADGAYALAVLPATHRIDLARLSLVLGKGPVRLAREDEVIRTFGDCERGALPPFGRLYGLTTVVDATLAGGSEIIFVGNARHEGVRMRYRDFEALEIPIRARFATAIEPRRRRPSHRRAG